MRRVRTAYRLLRRLLLGASLVIAASCGGGGGGGGSSSVGGISLTATVNGPSEVHLTWTEPATTVTGYSVYRNGQPLFPTQIDGTTVTDFNLTPNTGYCYQVYAIASLIGTVATSNLACVTTASTAGWPLTNVAAISNLGGFSSLRLDSFGYAHISYRATAGVALGTNSPAGVWSNVLIDAAAGGNGATSIAIDGADHTHVSYYDANNDQLMYATDAGGAWTSTPVAASSGYANAIVSDAPGDVAIAYSSSSPNYGLWYVERSGGTWGNPVFISGFGAPIASISLARDSSGLAHIAYAVGSGVCAIRYAAETAPTMWTDEVVSAAANCGAALALDANDTPNVAYVVSMDLFVAKRSSGIWTATAVDHMTWVGGADVSMAADASNHLYVTYQDNNADLKYATNASGNWVPYVIDAAGSVGAHSSLRVDSSGRAYISYDDATNHVLKYAQRP